MSANQNDTLYYELSEYNIAYNEKVNPMKSFVLRPYGTSYMLVEIFEDGYDRPSERACFAAEADEMTKQLRAMTGKLYDLD